MFETTLAHHTAPASRPPAPDKPPPAPPPPPPVGYAGDGPMFLGGEDVRARPYAEATRRVIDSEVARLLREAEEAALLLLRAHTDDLAALTDLLLERETIDGSQVHELIGRPVPGGPESPVTATHRSSDGDPPVDLHTTTLTEVDSHV